MSQHSISVLAQTLAAHDAGSTDGNDSGRAPRRYEHVALLGEGGMGRVERVRDCDLLRDVAVKHLRPELLADAPMLAQFLWEARVTAYLDHPNIVPVHDLGLSDSGELFFSMKLVRGATLETVIAEKRETVTRRLRMFLQLCNAMAFAHARGVLHRDLKPANVMVGEFGEIIVTDWGLALPLATAEGDALRANLPKGLAELSAGTPMYMSPEQIRGEVLDARTDVYALGVMLYELVALHPPYEASSVPDLFDKALRGVVRKLEGVSSSIAAVVARAMHVDASERYASVEALAKDVEAVLDGMTPDAERASLLKRAARYYVARDPAMAQLRVVDIDSWAFSAMLLGVFVTTLTARWIAMPRWTPWVALVVALLVATPATWRFLALRRRS